MDSFLRFIIVSSTVSIIGTVLYMALFRKTTFFRANRFYLLSVLALSLILPLLPWSRSVSLVPVRLTKVSLIKLPSEVHSDAPLNNLYRYSGKTNGSQFLLELGYLLALAGIIYFLIRFSKRLYTVMKICRATTGERAFGIPFKNTSVKTGAFCFFNTIVLNQSIYSVKELMYVLSHELIHVKEKHYADILMAEIFKIFFWYNPANWLIANFIKENLEYRTDQIMVSNGVPRKEYQYSLLHTVLQNSQSVSVSINFNFLNLNNRIQMMNKSMSPKNAAYRYLAALTLAIPVALFPSKGEAQVRQHVTARQSSNPTTLTVKLDTVGTNDTSYQKLLIRHLKMQTICKEFSITFPFFQDENLATYSQSVGTDVNRRKGILKNILAIVNIPKSTVAFSIDGREVSPVAMQALDWQRVATFGLSESKAEIEAMGIFGKQYLFSVNTRK